MPLFKVWDSTREKKSFFIIDPENVCQTLISAVSERFNITGERLVLEKDGTQVDQDDVLLLLSDETFMILQNNENWLHSTHQFVGPPSKASTITLFAETPPSETFSFTDSVVTLSNVTEAASGVEHASDENAISVTLSDIQSHTSQDKGTLDAGSDATSHQNNRNEEFQWDSYSIPWQKVPDYDIQLCEKGERNKLAITSIVHIVVDDMRQIKKDIPSRIFKVITKKMIDKYPEMFRDYDEDGVVLGDGSHSLYSKLYERNNYLNRPHKRRSDLERPTVTSKTVKLTVNSRAGCSNWQPERLTEDTDENIYARQRQFLNNIIEPPSFKDIKEKWPVLVEKQEILNHFKKLTGIDPEEAKNHLKVKGPKIVEFGTKKKIPSSLSDEIMENAIDVVSKHFKEDLNDFFYKLDDWNGLEAEELIHLCIVKIESAGANSYFPCMEKQTVVEEGYTTFLEAFVATFCLHYNFNLVYRKRFSTTLELVQRYSFKIHPDTGGKSKKLSVTKKKVIALIKKSNQ